MNEIQSLFVIGLVAVVAPLLARLPMLVKIPVVVLELLLGIVIGPGGMNWVSSQEPIGFLGEFGLIYLFFLAGSEINPDKIGGRPLQLGAIAWLISLALTVVFVGSLYLVGLLRAPLLVGIVLPTTAFGILLPILHESGDLEKDFGRYVLGAAAMGELGPLVLAPILLAHVHEHLHQTLFVMIFLLSAVGATSLAKGVRSEKLSGAITRWMSDRSILPLRISIVILLGLISLANELGMEIVLGAYTAGVVIAILVRDTTGEILQDRLAAVGWGFFIPLFFITSGIEFDLPALLSSPESISRLILFCAGMLIIRLIPAFVYRKVLADQDLVPIALFSSTTLPLVVAITYLGVRTGHMLPENAHALVGAAVLSVAIFPTLAIWLRSKPEDARPDRAVTQAICRIGDSASELFHRLLDLISPNVDRRP
jgi:Kef-type K+ transport system membrane component KefB